jgi:hypothetical protein
VARAVRSPIDPARILTEYWEMLATLPGEGLAGYGYTAPTLQDSTAGSNPFTAFFVTALTTNPGVFYESNVDSGYSVDNVPPGMPSAFAGQVVGGATHLTWSANAEPDLAGYRIYRGTSTGFLPDSAKMIALVADTSFVDPTAGTWYYKLTAANRSGYQSPSAALAPQGTTAVEGAPVPGALFLAAARPNPARAAAVLRFGLPREAAVSLAVFDVNGRLVREVARARFPAGEHAVGWDLHDSAGAPVSGGLFFIRLRADGLSRSGRLVVVR